ncbi:site-specific integrase [Polaromonas sp.]|uniref:site-specific integrase n=1 Tax=Polaromonas sp. TaxID=1869339 RepID=UPI003BAB5C0B
MASFEKRGDYQWRAKVRRLGQKPLSKTFDTKIDAMDWAREVERKIKRGEIDDLNPVTQRTTVAQAVTSYRTNVLPTLARQGKGGAAVHLRRIESKFGSLFVSALRSPGINVWALELGTGIDQLGSASIVHHLNTFSALIRHAQTVLGVHIPAGNPVKLVTRPATAAARDRVLRDGEFDLLIRAARDPGDGPGMQPSAMLEPMIRLALATTMRQGELLALRREWINLKTRVLQLPADATKNGDSRTVALSSEALKVLRTVPTHISGRVFGCWKDASSFSKPWQRLVKRAKRIYADDCLSNGRKADPRILENLRFHDLRHHATTELFSKGLNPFEVASMTGHKSMQMLKRYTHVDAAKLAQKLG